MSEFDDTNYASMTHDLREEEHLNSEAAHYESIGRIMDMWADIDSKLFSIFNEKLGLGQEKASFFFYRSPSIKEHLMLLNGFMKLTANEKDLGEWKEISADLDKNLEYRNHLAHNPVLVDITYDQDNAPPKIRHYSVTDANKRSKKVSRLSVEEIYGHMADLMPTLIKLGDMVSIIELNKGA